MTRRVILYPGEDGYMIAEVPSLPGCVSQGKTRDEAVAAKPTAKFDARWGQFLIDPGFFTRLVYETA